MSVTTLRKKAKSADESLTDAILAGIKPTVGSPWHRALPPDVQQEIREFRRRLQAGEIPHHGLTAVAQAMSDALTQRGYVMPKIRQVRDWLRQKN
jgi:hypothetical protein